MGSKNLKSGAIFCAVTLAILLQNPAYAKVPKGERPSKVIAEFKCQTQSGYYVGHRYARGLVH